MRSRKRQKNIEQTDRKRAETPSDSMALASSYNYSSRRNDETINVGRNEESKRLKPVKNISYKKRIIISIATIIVLIAAYDVLHISNNPQVITVYPDNQPTLPINNLSEFESSSKSLFSGIWNMNKITVNTVDIENKLKTSYPNLESISISIPLLSSRPKIYIEPALPSFVLKSTDNKYYSLDVNGRAIAEASSSSALGNNYAIIDDNSGVSVKLNQQVLPSSYITFMETVLAQLKAKGIYISLFTLPPQTQELDANVVGEPYFIKFNLQENDPRQQAGTFIATQKLLKSQNITPTRYIDVRVDGRAYYL